MGSTTLTTTTTNNKNNKPRCYPQQRFGISFRYSLNEKILKNSQACPLYMFHSSSARNLSTFEAAIGLRWRSNNYLAWAIILRLVQKVAHTRGEVARYFATSETCVIQRKPGKSIRKAVCPMGCTLWGLRHVLCHIRYAACFLPYTTCRAVPSYHCHCHCYYYYYYY